MVSEKQIAANRANGLKGGVKTKEGKLISRMNAVSHGIFSSDAVLPGEDAALLSELQESIMEELQPVGELETILVQRIITCTWRLKRVSRYELKNALQVSPEITSREDYIPGGNYRSESWHNLSRYESALERHIYRAIHELERLQKARLAESVPPTVVVDLTDSNLNKILSGPKK